MFLFYCFFTHKKKVWNQNIFNYFIFKFCVEVLWSLKHQNTRNINNRLPKKHFLPYCIMYPDILIFEFWKSKFLFFYSHYFKIEIFESFFKHSIGYLTFQRIKNQRNTQIEQSTCWPKIKFFQINSFFAQKSICIEFLNLFKIKKLEEHKNLKKIDCYQKIFTILSNIL